MTDPITPLTPGVPLAGPRGSSTPAKTAVASDALPEAGTPFAPTPQAALARVKKSARWKPRIIEKCFGAGRVPEAVLGMGFSLKDS